jgi:hypothetical protein
MPILQDINKIVCVKCVKCVKFQELKDALVLEFRGHSLLEACRQADPQKVNKARIGLPFISRPTFLKTQAVQKDFYDVSIWLHRRLLYHYNFFNINVLFKRLLFLKKILNQIYVEVTGCYFGPTYGHVFVGV